MGRNTSSAMLVDEFSVSGALMDQPVYLVAKRMAICSDSSNCAINAAAYPPIISNRCQIQ
jgi:hypothetical protein